MAREFNLKEAEEGKPIQWYSVHDDVWIDVTFIGLDKQLGKVVFKTPEGMYWTANKIDLRMAPRKRTVWVFLNHDGSADWYPVKQDVLLYRTKYLATNIPVEIEE